MSPRLILCALLFVLSLNIGAQQIKYPKTKKVEQTDTYFGTVVSDPYRWLEATDAPETKTWVDEQNKVTQEYLSRIPFRDKIKARLTELWNYPRYKDPFQNNGNYYFYKNDGLQNQQVLYVQKGLNGTPELVLDPNTFSTDGTVAMMDANISKDGRYLAYAVSKSGSDWREIFVYDLQAKQLTSDHIIDTKFGNANWFKDGFFYAHYDRPADANALTSLNEFQKVYYHRLGTKQEDDILIYSDDTNPKRSHYVWSSDAEDHIYLYIYEQGKRGNEIYVKSSPYSRDAWRKIYSNYDYYCSPIASYGSKLYMYSQENAPNGKVLLTDIYEAGQPWKTIISEKENVLDNVSIVGERIITQYMIDVVDKVYVHDLEGKYLREAIMPGVGNASGFNGDQSDTKVFYSFTSMLTPSSLYLYDIEKNESVQFKASEVKYNVDDYESKQVFYTSKDGTRVPMFLVYKKGLKLDGTNPTYLYSYGGFNISMKPTFSMTRMILLENGGVYAMPCIRGGSEYGEKWHEAAMKMNKQNVFDDFIAAAEYLIVEKYTSPEKLAIAGGSNGGLLVGVVMNQRPDLFKVAFPIVGVMDMLRYHKFTIGAGWSVEYGSSDDSEEMFKYLLGYSPLHNIKSGLNYPATMVMTADHDDRVVPSHSFKYISTLQEIYIGENPMLIRIESKAGHGSGKPTSKQIEQYTDEWSFMFYNMGITPNY